MSKAMDYITLYSKIGCGNLLPSNLADSLKLTEDGTYDGSILFYFNGELTTDCGEINSDYNCCWH